jgi:hypothetical protein
VLDGTCAVYCVSGTDWLCLMVTVLVAVCLERIGCVGRNLCSILWVWNGLVMLNGNYAECCGSGTDWLC